MLNVSHFVILLLCCSQIFPDDFYSKFYQKDYTIDFQRLILVDYNKDIMNFVEVKNFKYNRSLGVVNATINSKVNMSTELEVAVEAHKFLSNEYRRIPGTNFQINYCKSVHANIVGFEILFKQGNFSPTCEMVKDTTYKVWNAHPDPSRFPPFIPNGEYELQVEILYKNQIIANIAGYIKVYRPIIVKD